GEVREGDAGVEAAAAEEGAPVVGGPEEEGGIAHEAGEVLGGEAPAAEVVLEAAAALGDVAEVVHHDAGVVGVGAEALDLELAAEEVVALAVGAEAAGDVGAVLLLEVALEAGEFTQALGEPPGSGRGRSERGGGGVARGDVLA